MHLHAYIYIYTHNMSYTFVCNIVYICRSMYKQTNAVWALQRKP